MAGAVPPASEKQALGGESAAVQHSVDQKDMPGREAAPSGPCTGEQKVEVALPRKRKLEFVNSVEEAAAANMHSHQVTSTPWHLHKWAEHLLCPYEVHWLPLQLQQYGAAKLRWPSWVGQGICSRCAEHLLCLAASQQLLGAAHFAMLTGCCST